MAVSTRLKGNQGFFFSLKRGASTAVVFDDVKSYELTFEDKDSGDVTFSEATAGIGQNPQLAITGITSFDTGSLFKFLWDNAGASDVLVTFAPKGNSTTAAGKPLFSFTATLPGKPGFSNEAAAGTDGDTGAEFEFTLNGTTDTVWA